MNPQSTEGLKPEQTTSITPAGSRGAVARSSAELKVTINWGLHCAGDKVMVFYIHSFLLSACDCIWNTVDSVAFSCSLPLRLEGRTQSPFDKGTS